MTAVPRQASTGAPTSDTAGTPTYDPNTVTPFTTQGGRRSPTVIGVTSGPDGSTMDYTGSTAVSRHEAAMTGRTAIPRSEALVRQYRLPAEAVPIIDEYRRRTGGYPDLGGVTPGFGGSGGSGGGGFLPSDEGEPGITTAGFLGDGLNMWLALSAIGVVLVLMFGKKK